jgi:cytochrome c-type biogenesis protein CcmH/NrfG
MGEVRGFERYVRQQALEWNRWMLLAEMIARNSDFGSAL